MKHHALHSYPAVCVCATSIQHAMHADLHHSPFVPRDSLNTVPLMTISLGIPCVFYQCSAECHDKPLYEPATGPESK